MIKKLTLIVCIFMFFFGRPLDAQDPDIPPGTADDSQRKYVIQTIELPDGRIIEATITPSPPTPPPGFERPVLMRSKIDQIMDINILDEVPAFDWSFGCSATSAAMIAGYYDRHGFVDMYSGPTNDGLMPLDNSVWPDWSKFTSAVQRFHRLPGSTTSLPVSSGKSSLSKTMSTVVGVPNEFMASK